MFVDIRQMLLPILWLMLLPWFMTDVIVMFKADVIASCCLWQMLLPYSVRQMLLPILCGRC